VGRAGDRPEACHEVWWLVRKAPKVPLPHVLRWGTGGLDIDGTRVACGAEDSRRPASHANFGDARAKRRRRERFGCLGSDGLGRWPANVVLSDPVFDGGFPDEVVGGGQSQAPGNRRRRASSHPKASQRDRSVEFWIPPVENDQSQSNPSSSCATWSACVAPKGGLLLDPFAGSGSTGVAAVLEGVDYLLIEQDEGNAEIARERLGL